MALVAPMALAPLAALAASARDDETDPDVERHVKKRFANNQKLWQEAKRRPKLMNNSKDNSEPSIFHTVYLFPTFSFSGRLTRPFPMVFTQE